MGTSWLPAYEALPGEVEGYHWDVDDLGTWNPWNPFGWCPIETHGKYHFLKWETMFHKDSFMIFYVFT